MTDVLIDDATMTDIVGLDESAMPSRATVQYRATVDNPRGGSSQGAWTNRNAVPIACRVIAGGVRNRVTGESLQAVGDTTVQLSLTGLRDNGLDANDLKADDEIDVSTTVILPGVDDAVVERYKVVGLPSTGSYATNLAIPCVKVA